MGQRPRSQMSADELVAVRQKARERYARNKSPQQRRAYLRHLKAGRIRVPRPTTVEKYAEHAVVDEKNLSGPQ